MAVIHLSSLYSRPIPLKGGWLDLRREVFSSPSGEIQLTAIEARLLRVLLDHGDAVSRETLHAEVWRYSPDVQSRAADQTVKRLRKKLEEDPAKPRHLQTAHGIGYRFVPELSEPAPKLPRSHPQPPTCPTNLHHSPEEPVGRSSVVSELSGWLAGPPELATLTGTGGVGKTCIARSWAHSLLGSAEAPAGGVWLCDLAGTESIESAVGRIAQDLGLEGSGSSPLEALAAVLAARSPMLLVLDNVEQVAGALRPLLTDWTAAAPSLRVLATSRVRLGLHRERCIEVRPLAPEPAGELLEQRIRSVSARPLDREAVRALATALEGLPLAIELAATRCSLLSPGELLERLHAQLDLLSLGAAEGSDRHTSLRAVLSESWRILSPEEQDILQQCTVFRGTFSLSSAEAVLEPHDTERSLLDILQRLRDHSLVRLDPGSSSTRLSLLRSVRAFASEQPRQHEQAALEQRHARTLVRQVESCQHEGGLGAWAEFAALRADPADLKEAADRSEDFDDALGVRVLLARAWALRETGRADEAGACLRKARDRTLGRASLPEVLRCKVWRRHGLASLESSSENDGFAMLARSIALADGAMLGSSRVLARTETARAHRERNELEEAERLLGEASEIVAAGQPELQPLLDYEGARLAGARSNAAQAELLAARALQGWHAAGDGLGIATASYALGYFALDAGRLGDAEGHFQAAIEAFEALGDRRALSLHSLLGLVELERADLVRAEAAVRSSIAWCRHQGAARYLAEDLQILALICLLRREAAQAARHLAESESLFARSRPHMVRSVGLALSAVASARQQRFAEARAFLARVQEDEVRPRVLEGDRPTLDELAQALVDLAQNGAEALDSARALHQRVAAAGRLPLVSARVAAQLLEQALQEQTSS